MVVGISASMWLVISKSRTNLFDNFWCRSVVDCKYLTGLTLHQGINLFQDSAFLFVQYKTKYVCKIVCILSAESLSHCIFHKLMETFFAKDNIVTVLSAAFKL